MIEIKNITINKNKLKQAYLMHSAHLCGDCLPTVYYQCPDCRYKIMALVPPFADTPPNVAEGIMLCPECNELHYRAVYSNGRVVVNGEPA